jgi:outer membrane protein TolC
LDLGGKELRYNRLAALVRLYEVLGGGWKTATQADGLG